MKSEKGKCKICNRIRILHYLTGTCKTCYNAIADYNSKLIAGEPRYSVAELEKLFHYTDAIPCSDGVPAFKYDLLTFLKDSKRVQEALK